MVHVLLMGVGELVKYGSNIEPFGATANKEIVNAKIILIPQNNNVYVASVDWLTLLAPTYFTA